MLRLEDAVTLMQSNFNNINFLNRNRPVDFSIFKKNQSLRPFSDSVINYLNALSKELNKDPRTRVYPEIATFSFYCRRANLTQLKKLFCLVNENRLGRGTIFHITPSNVPVNFAYSLVTGLLSGNSNIVRVPSKDFDQVNIIIEAINNLSSNQEFSEISEKILLIRYDRSNNDATKQLSDICDVRIIWGGDDTIRQVRTNVLPPRSFDITFADRYSICVINANKFVKDMFPDKIALGFYNDTYLFDQNACTSPHLVVWLGSKENVKKSQSVFWGNLHKIVKEKYQIQPVQAVDKVITFYNQAINMKNIRIVQTEDNLLWRVSLDTLSSNLDLFRCSGGYFSEYHANILSELSSIINGKYQTLAYYGFTKKELEKFIYQLMPKGIDRIVPIGRTMDFSLNWDGYDLINVLSRRVEII